MKVKASEKLKLNRYNNIAIINLPAYLEDGFAINYSKELNSKFECILGFVNDFDSFDKFVKFILEKEVLLNNGILFLAYPKIKNNLGVEGIHRDALFPFFILDEETGYIGTTPMKFNTMLSLDDNYTVVGLKYDLSHQPKQKTSTKNDFSKQISELEKIISNDKKVSNLFKILPQGYKTGWANYIYSVNNEDTKKKRIEEMKMILGLGFKSRDFYLKQKKASK